ncbi:MYG1 family protein, partial [Escherichia coli]|uniref:MYG1 family protein n=1 Tax=Escherichia coli TaxID=562 RepID=UPI0015D48A7D
SEYREDGVIKYSSAGLVWKNYGHLIKDVNDFVYYKMDEEIIKSVDAVDNGIEGFNSPISDIISTFNPTWEDESQETENRQFLAAVKVARDYIENKIRFYKGLANAKNIVDNGEVIYG